MDGPTRQTPDPLALQNETVLRTLERNEVARWTARLGKRQIL